MTNDEKKYLLFVVCLLGGLVVAGLLFNWFLDRFDRGMLFFYYLLSIGIAAAIASYITKKTCDKEMHEKLRWRREMTNREKPEKSWGEKNIILKILDYDEALEEAGICICEEGLVYWLVDYNQFYKLTRKDWDFSNYEFRDAVAFIEHGRFYYETT